MKLSDLITPNNMAKAFCLELPKALSEVIDGAFLGTTCDFTTEGDTKSKVVLDVLTILDNIEDNGDYEDISIIESFHHSVEIFRTLVKSIPKEERPVFVFSINKAATEIKQLLDDENIPDTVKKALENFDIDTEIGDEDTLLGIDKKMETVLEDLFDDEKNPFLKRKIKE